MAREVLREAGGGRAAIISAPSVMNGIKVNVEEEKACARLYLTKGLFFDRIFFFLRYKD